MNYQLIEKSPLRHTYPYGKNDVELHYGTAEEMRSDIAKIFATNASCRRIVVAVPAGDKTALAECESAGLRYVLDVELRDGQDLSLLVAEQGWLYTINEEIEGLDLT